jgi:hypothetical protein
MKINERTHFTKFMQGHHQPKDPGATWRKEREDEEIETFYHGDKGTHVATPVACVVCICANVVCMAIVVEVKSTSTQWDDNMQEVAAMLLGDALRAEQWRFSRDLAPLISLPKEMLEATGVNDNMCVSLFPAFEAHLGFKEHDYSGLAVDGKLPDGGDAIYAPYKSLRHQHCQGVLNVTWCGRKRWELWDLDGRKWVLWTRRGDVVWLPPGWYHQVTSFDGDAMVVRVA